MLLRTHHAQQAESLRLRLRLALFKVQTDQTNIPLAQLRIPSHKLRNHQLPTDLSPEHSNPAVRALLPAPILKPTAYSIRKIGLPQMLSSPPSSSGSSPAKTSVSDSFGRPLHHGGERSHHNSLAARRTVKMEIWVNWGLKTVI